MADPHTNPQTVTPLPVLTTPGTKRPWSVTLLAVVVLMFTVSNLLRFVLSIRYWSFLTARSGISPIYLMLTGLVWSVAGGYLIYGLWRAKPWAPRLTQAIGLSYALYYWLDQLLLKDHSGIRAAGAPGIVLPGNWAFSAMITVIGLGFIFWVFNRSKVKLYFGGVTTVDLPNKVNHDEQGKIEH
jgi:hypothetical protein